MRASLRNQHEYGLTRLVLCLSEHDCTMALHLRMRVELGALYENSGKSCNLSKSLILFEIRDLKSLIEIKLFD